MNLHPGCHDLCCHDLCSAVDSPYPEEKILLLQLDRWLGLPPPLKTTGKKDTEHCNWRNGQGKALTGCRFSSPKQDLPDSEGQNNLQDSEDFAWKLVEVGGPKDTIFFEYMILAMNDVLDGFVGAIAYIFVLQNRLMQYPKTAVANERLRVLTQLIPSVVMRRREPGFTLSINKSL